jgi:formyltetrahydrofolate synthetase
VWTTPPTAAKKAERIEKDPELSKLGTCMVKTHLSLSDNPALKGVPKGWKLQIREVLTYGGAGFVVPVAGAISLMPGTGSNPAYRRVDVDTEDRQDQGHLLTHGPTGQNLSHQ